MPKNQYLLNAAAELRLQADMPGRTEADRKLWRAFAEYAESLAESEVQFIKGVSPLGIAAAAAIIEIVAGFHKGRHSRSGNLAVMSAMVDMVKRIPDGQSAFALGDT